MSPCNFSNFAASSSVTSGTTSDSAIALLGAGVNQTEGREDRGTEQATGDSGPSLPEEFRAGLDEYFNRLERGTSKSISEE